MRPRLFAPRAVSPPMPATTVSMVVCAIASASSTAASTQSDTACWSDDAALRPALGRHRAVAEQAQPLVFQQRYDAAGIGAARVKARRENGFRVHLLCLSIHFARILSSSRRSKTLACSECLRISS